MRVQLGARNSEYEMRDTMLVCRGKPARFPLARGLFPSLGPAFCKTFPNVASKRLSFLAARGSRGQAAGQLLSPGPANRRLDQDQTMQHGKTAPRAAIVRYARACYVSIKTSLWERY